jgi:hypothetical protein
MADDRSKWLLGWPAWIVAINCGFIACPERTLGDGSGSASAPSMVTGQVIRTPGSTDASARPSRLEALTGWFGLTQEDIRFSSPELFECLRAYATLPERFVGDSPPPTDDKALVKRLDDLIEANDRILALFVLHIRNSGVVYCREATGVYEHLKSFSNGVTVVSLRGADAIVLPMDEPTTPTESEVDDDYIQPWLDKSGTIRLRESQSITGVDNASFAWYVNDLAPKVLLGSWSEYLARKPVLLEFSEADQEKRAASEKKVVESEVMKDVARTGVLAALESLQWDEATAAEMAKRLEQADVSIELSPRDIPATVSRIFVLGDYLLLREVHGEDEFFTVTFTEPRNK